MEQITVPDKDLSEKDEDNKYEPFKFELKPDPHYEPGKAERPSSSSTSSSSTTDSEEDDDFIQLDTISLTNNLRNASPDNDRGGISRNNPNPNQFLFIPTLQPVFSTRPVETENRSDALAPKDTSRIPSSIFASPSKLPMEWSVNSAESLFSINFSNSSFARENATWKAPPPDSPTPPTPGSAVSAVSDVSLEGFGGPVVVLGGTGAGANDGAVKENGMELSTDGGRAVDVSVANSRRSDNSISSVQSFAFPLYDISPLNLYLLLYIN